MHIMDFAMGRAYCLMGGEVEYVCLTFYVEPQGIA